LRRRTAGRTAYLGPGAGQQPHRAPDRGWLRLRLRPGRDRRGTVPRRHHAPARHPAVRRIVIPGRRLCLTMLLAAMAGLSACTSPPRMWEKQFVKAAAERPPEIPAETYEKLAL